MLFLKFKKRSVPDDSLLQGQNVLRQTASIQLKCVVECMCVFSKKLFSMEKLVSKYLHECDKCKPFSFKNMACYCYC